MKKCTLIITILIITLLITTGCRPGTSNSPQNTGDGFVAKSNNKGLVISFQPGMPHSEYYENEVIPVEVLVKNEGDYNIEYGGLERESKLFLSGFDTNILQNFQREIILPEMEGMGTDGYGYSAYQNFGSGKIKRNVLNKQMTELNPTIRVGVCYPYKTTGYAEVCINPDIYGERRREGDCTPSSTKVFSGNAPVKISGVTERFLAYENGKLNVRFDITISNVGGGNVWDVRNRNYFFDCGEYMSREDHRKAQNKVRIDKISVSSIEFTCNEATSNIIELMGNSKTFTCKGWIPAVESYTTQMQMEFSYGYSDTIETKTRILSNEFS